MESSNTSSQPPNNIPVFSSKIDAKEIYNKNDKRIEKGIHLGWKWSRMRKAYLAQHPYCERCGLMADCVHHIIGRSEAPHLTYEWTNLMALCDFCHMKEHKIGEWKDEGK